MFLAPAVLDLASFCNINLRQSDSGTQRGEIMDAAPEAERSLIDRRSFISGEVRSVYVEE